jgi:hypothetical protein
MSLCIAAECTHEAKSAIVLCCDWRAERGRIYQELVGSEDVDKIRWIERTPFSAMLAGSETKADELLTACDEVIRKFSETPEDINSDLEITRFLENLRKVARARKREILEHYVGMTLGISYEDFLNTAQRRFTEAQYVDELERIRHLGLGAEVIICGFHGDEPLTVKLDADGEAHWETNYSVIGDGADIALAFLAQRDYDPEMPLMECLLRVYEAKRAAEVNRHVGKLTTFEVLVQARKRFDISDTCFKLLKRTVGKRHALPKVEFKGEYLEILEDEPAKESHQDLPLSSEPDSSARTTK